VVKQRAEQLAHFMGDSEGLKVKDGYPRACAMHKLAGTQKLAVTHASIAGYNQQKANIGIDPNIRETHCNGLLAKMGLWQKLVDKKNGSRVKMCFREYMTINSPNRHRPKTSWDPNTSRDLSKLDFAKNGSL